MLKDASSVPGRAFTYIGIVGLIGFGVFSGLFALFVVHQVTLWLSLDPEKAFNRSRKLVTTFGSVWDTTANIYNSFLEVVLVALPAWNSGVEYIVQPTVFVALDIFSLAFTKKPYRGIISDNDVPYEGFECPDDGSMGPDAEWCGKLSYYADQLGYTTGSPQDFVSNSTIVLSLRTARRLSELTGDPIVGVLDLGQLAEALQSLLSAAIVIIGTLSDIVFHVVHSVLTEVFEIVFDLFMTLVKVASYLVMMLIRSGLLTALLKIGIDLIVVLIVDIGIPYLLAVINLILCLVDLTQVAGWTEQLDCGALLVSNPTTLRLLATLCPCTHGRSGENLLPARFGRLRLCRGLPHVFQHSTSWETAEDRLLQATQQCDGAAVRK